jgi:inhibitor of cysteine peptidase
MIKLKIIVFTILLITTSICFAKDFTDPSKSIMVDKSSPTFTIKLQSNPSTGFSWFLVKYDSNLITPISHKYIAPDTKLVGAPGYEEWVFKADPRALVVPQITKIQLAYTRPWNLEGYRTTTFKVVTHDS